MDYHEFSFPPSCRSVGEEGEGGGGGEVKGLGF